MCAGMFIGICACVQEWINDQHKEGKLDLSDAQVTVPNNVQVFARAATNSSMRRYFFKQKQW